MTARTLVVGDVQGCRDELEDLLSKVGFARGTDRLVSVGDLVNRGPASLATLRLAQDLRADVVLGNHEIHLLRVAAGLRPRGKDTFGDVLDADDRDDLLDWIVDRPEPLVLLRDYVVVHAGFPPGFHLPDEAQDLDAFVQETWTSKAPLADRVSAIASQPMVHMLTRMRHCDEAGRMPSDDSKMDPPGFRPWFEHRAPGPRIVFGHWARLDPARAKRDDLRFLDTGCVYGGRLTGWMVEDDRIVSVPARKTYVKVR